MPLLLSFLLLLAPLPALAVTVFGDGGVHVIDGPGGAVEVLNGTTVLTVPGAEIGAITSTDATVGVFGGSIDWRRVDDEFTIINGPGPAGIDAVGGSLTVDAGEVQGGRGAPAVSALDVVSLTISGGTLLGGVDTELLAAGPALLLEGATTALITGGMFVGGAESLVVSDTGHVEIRGGVFEGRWAIRGPDTVVEVFGNFDADTIGFRGIEFPFGGRILRGVLEDGSLLDVAVILEDGASPPVIHELPEPSAMVLSLAAVGTLVGLRSRRRDS